MTSRAAEFPGYSSNGRPRSALRSFATHTRLYNLGAGSSKTSNVNATTLKLLARSEKPWGIISEVYAWCPTTCAKRIQRGQAVCQQIPWAALDNAIGKLLVDTVTPLTLEVALAVQAELESRCDKTERLRLHEVERARYQSDLARQRFMHVDPGTG